jgi:hypothetical protein
MMGVLHQEVHAPETLCGRANQLLARFGLGDVGRDGRRFAAEEPYLLGDRLEVALLTGGKHDVHPVTGKADSDAPSNSRPHARHDCDFPSVEHDWVYTTPLGVGPA